MLCDKNLCQGEVTVVWGGEPHRRGLGVAAEGGALQEVGGHSDGMSPTVEGWGTV